MKNTFKIIFDFITTLLLVSLVTFFTFQLLPGSSALAILGPEAEEAQIEALEQELGLDQPLATRYIKWAGNALCGNLGTSYKLKTSVSGLIAGRFKVTGTLTLFSFFLTVIIGLFCGIFFAQTDRHPLLKPLSYLNQFWFSIPSFCCAILLILVFTVKLHLLPSMGITGFSSYILPSLAISLGSGAILARYISTNIQEEFSKDYVRTAYSKGLTTNQVIYRHILRNALLSSITTLGIIITEILGGSIIIENVFSIPGIGKLLADSINTRDFPLLQGLVLYLAFITLTCNFVTDLLYTIIDPRTKQGRAE